MMYTIVLAESKTKFLIKKSFSILTDLLNDKETKSIFLKAF